MNERRIKDGNVSPEIQKCVTPHKEPQDREKQKIETVYISAMLHTSSGIRYPRPSSMRFLFLYFSGSAVD